MKRYIHLFAFVLALLAGRPYVAIGQQHRPDEFKKVDEHADMAPADAARSMEELATWLTKPFATDEEKARALFRWITENISYDLDSYFSGNLTGGDATSALKKRTAVCEGYSGLFESLAKSSGLEVVKISGFAKGYRYSIGQGISGKPNHAWNAVKINGDWKLMDCTWGSGYVGDDKKFHKRFSPYYFFVPPEEFVYAHFPQDEKWQLLQHPLSKEEYSQLVYLRPKFFSLGMKAIDETKSTIHTDGIVTAKLFAPENVFCVATLTQGAKTLGDPFTFVQQDGDTVRLNASLPSRGTYTLRLFAKDEQDTGKYEWALDYKIEADHGSGIVYPKVYGTFADGRSVLYEPYSGVLRPKTTQHFRLKVPKADKVAIVCNNQWSYLKQASESFEGDAKVGKGKILVLGKFPGHENFDVLLEYVGK